MQPIKSFHPCGTRQTTPVRGHCTWWRVIFLIAAISMMSLETPIIFGQMTDELAGVFRQIMEHVDADLRLKFERALREQTDLIQFTPEEFRRFRDHPINPFDSLLEIDPGELNGNIELKFELPSLRSRSLHPAERQHPALLSEFRATVAEASRSTVAVLRGDKQVALGVIIDHNGGVLTKASELAEEGRQPAIGATVRLAWQHRRDITASIVRLDPENDLALLRSDLTDTVPVTWNTRQPSVGEFVLVSNHEGNPVAIGTYSHAPRPVLGAEKVYLGVQPQETHGGIRIVEVTPGSAAEKAGIRNGDILRRFNGKPVADVAALVDEIRRQRPGTVVQLEIMREGRPVTAHVELSRKKLSDERAARFLMMNRLGAIPSQRANDFLRVFQHDTPLFPEQCGGPVLDLDGNAIGLNIARQGRVSTLALPAEVVQESLARLVREDVASQRR